MILDQDGAESLPEEGFIYLIVASEEDALEKNVVGIYAGNVFNLEGGALNIAKAVYLSLKEERPPVERSGYALYTDARADKYFTDPEKARFAINKSVPDSDKRIDDFFNTAAKRKEEPFNRADYLQKGTKTDTEEAESINPKEEQQA